MLSIHARVDRCQRLVRLVRHLSTVATAIEELILNIRTIPEKGRPREKGATSLCGDHYRYDSLNYWYLRKIFRMLKPGPGNVVYDIGSGAGRIVCFAARHGAERCVGVELISGYCDIARRNAESLAGRHSPIDIICADAAQVDLSDGDIYFINNPFGPETLLAVLTNIGASLEVKPRSVTVVYCNPTHEEVFTAAGWRKIRAFTTVLGFCVSFWSKQGVFASDGTGTAIPKEADDCRFLQQDHGIMTW